MSTRPDGAFFCGASLWGLLLCLLPYFISSMRILIHFIFWDRFVGRQGGAFVQFGPLELEPAANAGMYSMLTPSKLPEFHRSLSLAFTGCPQRIDRMV